MSELVHKLRSYDGWQASEAQERTLCDEAANRIEELEAKRDDLMLEIKRAREIIDRVVGQRERLFGALNKMVANESMVEAAHAKAGHPYLNTALTEARAVLGEFVQDPAQ